MSLTDTQKTNEIMKDIEEKTEKIVKVAIETGKIVNPRDLLNPEKKISTEEKNNNENILQNIMKSGENEFKQKTGRYPTYSEMRSMYG